MADKRTTGIYPMDLLDDFEISDGNPDPRGWTVLDPEGRNVGTVRELLADTAAMKVRYLEIELDADITKDHENHSVIIPVGTARLDAKNSRVQIQSSSNVIGDVPVFSRSTGAVSREHEELVLRGMGAGAAGTAAGASARDYYDRAEFDASRFYRSRVADDDREPMKVDEDTGALTDDEVRERNREREAGTIRRRSRETRATDGGGERFSGDVARAADDLKSRDRSIAPRDADHPDR